MGEMQLRYAVAAVITKAWEAAMSPKVDTRDLWDDMAVALIEALRRYDDDYLIVIDEMTNKLIDPHDVFDDLLKED